MKKPKPHQVTHELRLMDVLDSRNHMVGWCTGCGWTHAFGHVINGEVTAAWRDHLDDVYPDGWE